MRHGLVMLGALLLGACTALFEYAPEAEGPPRGDTDAGADGDADSDADADSDTDGDVDAASGGASRRAGVARSGRRSGTA